MHLDFSGKSIFIFLAVLILASAILRFYKLPQRQYWMIDEERDAFIVKKILIDYHPTLIGGALPGGFYLAPGYFYISAFFYYFFNLNPIGMGYLAAFLGVATIPLIFYVAKKLFNPKVGILAAFFYTFSYLTVIYNRTWWPLTFSPIVALVCYWSLFQIIKSKNLGWVLILALALIIGVQSDPSNFSLVVLTIIIWIIFKLPIRVKPVILAIGLFIISHLPLVIFDFRHDFLNSKALLKFFSGQTGAGINFDPGTFFESLLLLPRSFARFLWVFGEKDVAVQIVPAQVYTQAKYSAIPLLLLLLAIVILGLFFIGFTKAGKRNLGIFIIGLHMLVAIFGIILQNFFFGNWNFEWLMQVLFPAYAVVFALFVNHLLKYNRFHLPVIGIISSSYLALIIFAIFSAKTIIASPNSFNLHDKMRAVEFIVEKTEKEQFSLDSIGQNFTLGGYRYLFYLAGKEPVKSYMDYVYADWLYPKKDLWQDHPATVAVIVNKDICIANICPQNQDFESKYQQYLAKAKDMAQFGHIEVLIVDNTSGWVKW